MTDKSAGKVVDLMTESLLPGRSDIVRQLFNAEGLRAPEVIWSPTMADLRSPRHRQFAQMVTALADADGRVPADRVRAEDFGALADWLMLIDIEDGGRDFRYAYYGRRVREASGIDMTGRHASDFTNYLATFFSGLYRAVCQTGAPVFSEHEPPRNIFIRAWQRLIYPLFGPDGAPQRLLVLNLPDNELKVGLELMVDPVFVMTADRSIIYTNRAARLMFRIEGHPAPEATLEDLTGIEFDLCESAEELLGQNKVVDSLVLAPRGDMMERLAMTISAAEHRGQAFYVVIIRTIGA